MAAITNTTTSADITTTVREIDFISRFTRNINALREIMGIAAPVRKQPGTKLVSSKATVTLQSGTVAEGDEVPLSKVQIEPVAYEDIVLGKYRKAVTAEAVAKHGAAVAVQKSDDAFLQELQGVITDNFYSFIQTGTLTGEEETFQMAVAMAVAKVKDKFKKMRLDYSEVVVMVNTVDAGRYLGSANITVQTRNGIEYVKDFVGVETMIITSEIPEGTVIATPAENLIMYYIDPADGDFQQLGLEYTTSYDETSLIGIHKEGNYGRVMGETHALMGIKILADYIDAVAVYSIGVAASGNGVAG